MFKLQNQFKITIFYLFTLLGLLIILHNHQVMAMNNGHISQNNGHDNDYTNFQLQARILQNLNFQQSRIIQQIFNARNNNASEEVISNLVSQNVQLSQRISAQQIIVHNAMPRENNPNQPNNPRRR
ncbi:MAG: SVM family protein [Candidatus Phytoplasma vitis]|nr:MAG: SVM family protein [Candidatus Phytoplasma vitis]